MARHSKDAKTAIDAKPAKKKREIKLVGGLVAGAIGGIVATWALDKYQEGALKATRRAEDAVDAEPVLSRQQEDQMPLGDCKVMGRRKLVDAYHVAAQQSAIGRSVVDRQLVVQRIDSEVPQRPVGFHARVRREGLAHQRLGPGLHSERDQCVGVEPVRRSRLP